jgi:hypothetical protein
MPTYYHDDATLHMQMKMLERHVESMWAAGARVLWLRLWEDDYYTLRRLAGYPLAQGQLRFMDIPVYIRKGVRQ